MKQILLICSMASLLVLSACTRDSTPIVENTPPVPSFYPGVNHLISSSTDNDGDILDITWTVNGVEYPGSIFYYEGLGLTGEHNITLTVSDGVNAPVWITEPFTFNNVLVADFSSNYTIGQAPLNVTFNASASALQSDKIDSYNWDFQSDGLYDFTSKLTSSSTFEFVNPGTYYVKLKIIGGGNSDEMTKVIIVTAPSEIPKVAPEAAFEITPANGGQAPITLTLNGNSSEDEDGFINDWEWSINGDIQHGSVIYYPIDMADTYNITLVVTDNDNIPSAIEQKFIVITAANLAPVANAILSTTSGEAPLTVNLDASSSTDDNLQTLSYLWEIDGNEYTDISLDYEFTVSGTKNIILTVMDEEGLFDSKTFTVEVDAPNGAPDALISASIISGEAPLAVRFDGSGSTDDNGIINYVWLIEGENIGGSLVNHTFNNPGPYVVQLTVTDNDGVENTDSVTINVTAPNEAPVAVINAPVTTGQTPLTISFDAGSSTDDSEIVSYDWDVDGETLSGVNPSITLSAVKVYTVTLTVTDDQGLTDTDTITVNVTAEARPVSDVLPPYDGVIDLIKMIGNPDAELQTTGNPFSDSYFYASPDVYHAINETSLDFEPESQSSDSMYQKMKYTQRMPSAIWMDSIATIYGNDSRRSLEEHLDAALAQQKDYQDNYDGGDMAPMNIVVIIYNLPDRDCAALASSGLLVEVGDDTKIGDPAYDASVGTGLDKYQNEYIDVIADLFNDPKYDSLRIVAMLEPDSYPNMISNQNPNVETDAYCIKLHDRNNDSTGQSGVYTAGLRYAINSFAQDSNSNVYTYIDIGHSGWLGWEGNRDLAVNGGTSMYWNVDTVANDPGGEAIGFTNLVDGADGSVDGVGLDMIRGFASNTSGYTPLYEPYFDGTNAMSADSLYFEWNPMVDELHFIETLDKEFQAAGFGDNNLGFIIDTARNGWGKDDGPAEYQRPTSGPATKDDDSLQYRVDKRTQRGRWCNVMDAGVGESPQADPLAEHPWIDAFYWMKPPGESDGSSNPADENAVGKSYDPVCGGVGTPKTGMVPGRVIGNAAGLDTRTDRDAFYAPTAGLWFDEQYRMLIDNAHPPLGEKGKDNNDFDSYDYDTAIVPATP